MELLKFEFTDAPDASYNGILGKLVREVRYLRKYVPIDEFERNLPKLQRIERELQDLDDGFGEDMRFYIEEIMDELDQEQTLFDSLNEDIERAIKVLLQEIHNKFDTIDIVHFQIQNTQAIYWLQINSYRDDQIPESIKITISQIIQSLCYKHGVIFIS